MLAVRKLLVVLYRMFPHLLLELSTCTTEVDCTCEVSVVGVFNRYKAQCNAHKVVHYTFPSRDGVVIMV